MKLIQEAGTHCMCSPCKNGFCVQKTLERTETLLSEFLPESSSYLCVILIPWLFVSNLSVREAQGWVLCPGICTLCLLSRLRTKSNTSGAASCYCHFLRLLWRGSVTWTPQLTTKTCKTSQTPSCARMVTLHVSNNNSELG